MFVSHLLLFSHLFQEGITLCPHQGSIVKSRSKETSQEATPIIITPACWVCECFICLLGLRNKSVTFPDWSSSLQCSPYYQPTGSLFTLPANLLCQKYKEVHRISFSQANEYVPSKNKLHTEGEVSHKWKSYSFKYSQIDKNINSKYNLSHWLTTNKTPPQMSGIKSSWSSWQH